MTLPDFQDQTKTAAAELRDIGELRLQRCNDRILQCNLMQFAI